MENQLRISKPRVLIGIRVYTSRMNNHYNGKLVFTEYYVRSFAFGIASDSLAVELEPLSNGLP